MKAVFNTLMGVVILVQVCNGQAEKEREIFIEAFNWTITIPENFEKVAGEDWAIMQNRGKEAIEDTYNQEIVNDLKTVFIFKSDQMNYFEANSQPYDVTVDGDYVESCKQINEILYETFVTQMPDVLVDTLVSSEMISDLEFQKFEMEVTYPNTMILKVFMYTRLFDNKELTVNIMYIDNQKGKQMLESWRKSKFNQ